MPTSPKEERSRALRHFSLAILGLALTSFTLGLICVNGEAFLGMAALLVTMAFVAYLGASQ